jgi:hypothetical protein
MKKGILALLAVVLAFAISGWAADDERSKADKRLDDGERKSAAKPLMPPPI